MKKLKWGQTPWDKLTKEELLREVQQLYSALISVNSVMKLTRAGQENSLFWGAEGSGGRSLYKAQQILEPIYKKFDSESMHRFFRYADSLLFDVPKKDKWWICTTCHWMITNVRRSKKCDSYFRNKCTGKLRLFTWEDLKSSPSL